MNIELKPIAESKVRQLGGDVCGVLVRTDDGVMAVSEHGRCTRLDAGVMGPVEPAGASERELFEQEFREQAWGIEVDRDTALEIWTAARARGGQGAEVVDLKEFWQKLQTFVDDYVSGYEFRGEGDYTPNEKEQFLIEDCVAGLLHELSTEGYLNKSAQPQPAVPEGWKLVPAEITAGQLKAAWDEMALYLDEVSPVYDLLLKSAPQPPAAQSESKCCCGETDNAWRLCPEHGAAAGQEGA